MHGGPNSGEQRQRRIEHANRVQLAAAALDCAIHVLVRQEMRITVRRDDEALDPDNPRRRQASKNPSIFRLMPPMTCTLPCGLIAPVTANECRNDFCEMAGRSEQPAMRPRSLRVRGSHCLR